MSRNSIVPRLPYLPQIPPRRRRPQLREPVAPPPPTAATYILRVQRQLVQIQFGLYLFGLFLLGLAMLANEVRSAEPVPAAVHTVPERTYPTATPVVEQPVGVLRMAKLSHYWPPLGGPNCATFVNGQCISKMASGLPWQDWIGRAAACPSELPFWTTITLPGGEQFLCLDRGGKIVTTPAGELWIDLLVASPPVPYGTTLPVTVLLP